MNKTPSTGLTTHHRSNCTLHWAYLEFAIRSSRAVASAVRPPSIPASRNVIEAIRYSYDFIDAAAEFAYVLVKDSADGDLRPGNWLRGYVDRHWPSSSLAEKLGFLAFCTCGQAFWRNDNQRRLFEELRTVRDALTHPGIFSVVRVEHFADYSSPALSTRETIDGRMQAPKKALAKFAQHPKRLGPHDARKAVEIALRHSQRFEELFDRQGACLFGRVNASANRGETAAIVLKRMKRRHFDALWHAS
jgi:hypothetical protein